MLQPILAAKDYGDWIQVIFVVVVVLASAIGKIAQSLIARINERQQERRTRGTRPEALRPKPADSDRPVARPMPMAPARRTGTAPFGEGTRRDRTTTALPPVSARPDGIEDALAEVLGQLGLPRKSGTRGPNPASSSNRPPQRKPAEPRSQRTVVSRTTRAPMAGSPSKARPQRSSPPTPPATVAGRTQQDGARSTAQRAPANLSPADAEQHLGHLRSDVEARETAMERAPEHLAHLHSVLVQEGGPVGARRVGSVRGALGLNDRQSARRAILLAEVLGPPLSMRDIV